MINDYFIRVFFMAVEVAHDLEAAVLSVGTLYATLINIRASIVGPFRLYFSLLIRVSIATLVILARVVFILQRMHILGFLVEVAIFATLSSGHSAILMECFKFGAFNHYSRVCP